MHYLPSNIWKFLSLITVLIAGINVGVSQSNDLELANEYYQNGEYHKAISYYEELSSNSGNIPAIYKNYLQSLFYVQDFDKAAKFCKKSIKVNTNNYAYKVDLGMTDFKQGKKEAAGKYFEKLIKSIPTDGYFVKQAAEQFVKYDQLENAELTYVSAQNRSGNAKKYFFDLTNIYFKNGQKDKLTAHLLNGLNNSWASLGYVQNIFQRLYQDKDYEKLELKLLDMVQADGSGYSANELLIWLYYQRKDFENALLQAKSYDRKRKSDGKKVLEVGKLSMKNKYYDIATQAFQHIIDRYPKTPAYKQARSMIVQTKEELVKTSYPIDTLQIRSLIADYQNILDEFGLIFSNAHLLKRMAILHAFYLDEKKEAIALLSRLTTVRNISRELRAQAKLVKGDIYVLQDEPWEAILIYGQVEKENKYSSIAHEAKFKGAKLSYYIGEFELAKSHMDILKEATSKEIANDAIDLSVFIADNSGLDTSYDALAEFAQIELLIFQNKFEAGALRLDKMLKDYPDHSLTDEIYWKQAELLIRMGKSKEALLWLGKIEKNFSDDILADDAVFKMAELYEYKLNDKVNAQEYYKRLLLDHSGSVFINEARKRFRKLRGDFN